MSENFWEKVQGKIAEEAYFHFLNGCPDSEKNWIDATREIKERIGFIAFYMHENDINKSPLENWVEAEKIFVENF